MGDVDGRVPNSLVFIKVSVGYQLDLDYSVGDR